MSGIALNKQGSPLLDGRRIFDSLAPYLLPLSTVLVAGHFRADRYATLDSQGAEPHSFEEATFDAACLVARTSATARILVLANDIDQPEFSAQTLPMRYVRLLEKHGIDKTVVVKNGAGDFFSERRLRNAFPSKTTSAVDSLELKRSHSAFTGRSLSFALGHQRKELLTISGAPNCAATTLELFSLTQLQIFEQAVFMIPDLCTEHVLASSQANVNARRMRQVVCVSFSSLSFRIEAINESSVY